jgi:hypothetical protein
MKPGQVELFMAPRGRSQAHMQQVAADVTRCKLQGKVRLSLVLGIEVSTREVIEIVMAIREGDSDE